MGITTLRNMLWIKGKYTMLLKMGLMKVHLKIDVP